MEYIPTWEVVAFSCSYNFLHSCLDRVNVKKSDFGSFLIEQIDFWEDHIWRQISRGQTVLLISRMARGNNPLSADNIGILF